MNKRRLIIVTLIITWVMLALPAPVQATHPSQLMFTADMWINPDGSSASGTFSANGLIIENNMPAEEVFFIDFEEGTIHGVKTLSGAHGTIVIKYQAVLTFYPDGSGEAVGHYTILSGTGDYYKLRGVGDTEATIDMFGHILATYEGWGHID